MPSGTKLVALHSDHRNAAPIAAELSRSHQIVHAEIFKQIEDLTAWGFQDQAVVLFLVVFHGFAEMALGTCMFSIT